MMYAGREDCAGKDGERTPIRIVAMKARASMATILRYGMTIARRDGKIPGSPRGVHGFARADAHIPSR
jgi:hypothetical protein